MGSEDVALGFLEQGLARTNAILNVNCNWKFSLKIKFSLKKNKRSRGLPGSGHCQSLPAASNQPSVPGAAAVNPSPGEKIRFPSVREMLQALLLGGDSPKAGCMGRGAHARSGREQVGGSRGPEEGGTCGCCRAQHRRRWALS